MGLESTINDDIKRAIKSKDKVALEGLRAIKSALLLLKTDSQANEIKESDELKILQKLAKQRRDSAEIYAQRNRTDLQETELEQLKIIERYLPKPLSKEELSELLDKIIATSGATDLKDMGKVMGIATKTLAGKADGKRVSEMVKEKLN
ncbi:glutamyl-tRNA amidotransferase [Elysia marginata]|uniref:Glutamyl-tRNA amidotransferase n=1 Tax=Elysia marginata TaxID=1093978 RepID=A0AAV4FPC1_9GAST|nr:glutamyl-tRNA amidotransferase [Elysia marginata]